MMRDPQVTEFLMDSSKIYQKKRRKEKRKKRKKKENIVAILAQGSRLERVVLWHPEQGADLTSLLGG